MYGILAVSGCFPHVYLMVDENGDVYIFKSYEDAYAYAEENCAWSFSVVELPM